MTLSTTFLVFAFRPEEGLAKSILHAKSKTRALAGDQIYLSHPPHLTLYVSAFDDPDLIARRCEALVAFWKEQPVEVIGWHRFTGDVLTGNQTLVCELNSTSQDAMRKRQTTLIAELAPLRNQRVSQGRYASFFGNLTADRQAAVNKVGFPFIQDDWIAHLTIASIEAKYWPQVWQELEHQPPTGNYKFDRLSIFKLVDDFPEDWINLDLP